MSDFVPGRPHWWQWPTVLSLDAPAVALAWQWLMARTAGAALAPHHAFILAAAVWLVYAADRWIEGFLVAPGTMLTQRHDFYQRHRRPIAVIWVVMLLAGGGTALRCLDLHEIAAGLLLLVPVLLYLLSHQLLHRHHPWRIPKELCVAVLFAAGTACFSLVRVPEAAARLAVPLLLFGLLCFANCALISLWEDEVDRAHGRTSLALQFPRARGLVHGLPWIIALLGAGFVWTGHANQREAVLCGLAAGLLLGGVDLLHRHTGRQVARVLADLVLLTPLVPWLASRGRF